jgi:hypothetical protein
MVVWLGCLVEGDAGAPEDGTYEGHWGGGDTSCSVAVAFEVEEGEVLNRVYHALVRKTDVRRSGEMGGG